MQNKNYSKTLTTQKTRFFTTLHNKFSNYFTNCIAFILYKLNKPLPHTYQFYFITHHATGHNAMMDFLKLCGISINGDIQNINALQRYKQNYKRLTRFHTHCALALCECNFKGYCNYTHLLNAKAPALLLVRDPISILKSCINFVATPKEKRIIRGCGADKLLGYLQYCAYNPKTKEFHLTDSPCLETIESYVISYHNKTTLHTLFIFDELLSDLPHITQKYYVDMEEIKGDKAFETMQKLSYALGFPPPKEEDRPLFKKQVYAHLYFLFPFHLVVTTKDSEVKLLLANRTRRIKGIDITEKLMPPSYQNNPNLENCKVFVETHKEVQEISRYFTQIQTELIATLEILLKIVEIKKSKTLNEENVLKYFASHPKIAKDFKAILDKDLRDLKAQRPDIIKSWKYYQTFELLMQDSTL
ncbi:DUF2972 domain-containing protein [Helicobacter rodentium]|uniref:DUF2972 domain-containing protein n=1 Tax=Helicobacter rodentium TaxID=59617 RepID=UPI00047EBAA7|nr:DUF2972 domain-containing protein [Helicobacter rodentium]